MTIFGKSEEERASETRAKLEADAIVVEAEEMRLLPERHKMALADHQADLDAYRLETRRWGDFLALFIRRHSIADHPPDAVHTSVNLAQTKAIRLFPGNPADMCGTLAYWADQARVDHQADGFGVVQISSYDSIPPSLSKPLSPGMRWEVTSDYQYGVPRFNHPSWPRWTTVRPTFYVASPDERRPMFVDAGFRGVRIERRTPNYVRWAKDCRIVFEGVGVTLYVPGGTGAAHHEQILREIGWAHDQRQTAA